MGITGLLPFLKSIQKDIHVSSLKGLKVGVDAYCWLHKGAYSCATQIVMKTADMNTLPFINYCLRRVNLLRQHDVTPIIVFDGGYLPTKANTEKERRQRRQSYLTKGKELLKQGKKSEAHDCFQKGVDISPEMALVFIKECRKLNVQCIVAPYEADAQLAYLSKEGLVDVVITEDSDLLVFGARKVFYKMDEFGNGKLIEMKDLGKAHKNLIGFTEDSFRQMCILSGCDYLPSVPGIGLGKAAKLMRKCNRNATQAIRSLRCENTNVPSNYEVEFKRAEFTFLYQLVFDPRTQQQVRLNALPEGVDPSEFEFAGMEHSPKKAIHMARGNINPITMEVMDFYSPSKAPSSPKSCKLSTSSWSCSAMGTANKHYPVAIQAKLPITSSARSSRPFKPPARTNPESKRTEQSDGMLSNEELLKLYGGGSGGGGGVGGSDTVEETTPASGGHRHTPASNMSQGSKLSLSKFFAVEDSHSDVTPDETDSDQLEQCVRRLETSQDLGSPDATPCSMGVGAGVSVDRSGARKRLFPISSKLSQFMYSGTKRRRSGLRGQGAAGGDSAVPVRKNPFAVSGQEMQHQFLPVTQPSGSPAETEALSPDPNDESQAASGLASMVQRPPAVCSGSPVLASTSDGPSSPPVTRTNADCSSPVAMEMTPDPTSSPVADTFPSSNPHSHTETNPVKDRSWFGAAVQRRKSLPNLGSSSKSKQSARKSKVGLSRSFKPPRLSEPEPGQSVLAAFKFTGKPQMKL